ncbi:hypothetical protein ACP70R_024680 [Stipagrostis hirtigluma subsp. patula]
MAAEAPRGAGDGGAARMKLLCSHGGSFLPRGPDGAPRYVGGETRALVVPREASFRDLAARLAAEMAGGAEVRELRHRLADAGLEDYVLVSVTCDEELAHMRDEYDRLRATRPAAAFRVFVSSTAAPGSGGRGAQQQQRRSAPGLPPLPPQVRRVQSEQALAARAQLHRRHASPAPMRRVQSAQELAGARRAQPCFYRPLHQCRCVCHRRNHYAPAPARPMNVMPYMSKIVNGVRSGGQESAPAVSASAKAKARSRDVEVAMEKGRAIWELE